MPLTVKFETKNIDVTIWDSRELGNTELSVTLARKDGSYEDCFRVDGPLAVAKELREIAAFLETRFR